MKTEITGYYLHTVKPVSRGMVLSNHSVLSNWFSKFWKFYLIITAIFTFVDPLIPKSDNVQISSSNITPEKKF